MPLNFTPISLDRQEDYRARLSHCPQQASDYSFINLWGWAEEHGLHWAWEADVVFLLQTLPAHQLWAPIGAWNSLDWQRLLEKLPGSPISFARIPETLVALWESIPGLRMAREENRGHWDYLYDVQELIDLKGNRFHKKKNLISQFRKRHPPHYLPLDAQTVEAAIAMQENWCQWRDCEAEATLASENRAIERVLRHWDRLSGIRGGALLVDDRMVAYTVAEPIAQRTMLIHFEKADQSIKGAYQSINQAFLSNGAEGCLLVNREQDLDNEGLRKAKLSYQPVDFVKKYKVTLR